MITSNHEYESWTLLFLGSFFSLLPASLCGGLAPSAWNSSGHREAAGLSFVSSNHSYWFEVGGSHGAFVLCREGRLGCTDPVRGCWSWHGLGGWCCLATAPITFLFWVKLFSGTVFSWECPFLLDGGWHTNVASKAEGKPRFPHLLLFCMGSSARFYLYDWWYLCGTCRALKAIRKCLFLPSWGIGLLLWFLMGWVKIPWRHRMAKLSSYGAGYLNGQLQAVTARPPGSQIHAISSCLT